MENTLKNLQKKELELLFELTKIIKKLNLQYYAIGGTCLGAIRHRGFIPWDDDLDIILPRHDYEILFNFLKKNQNNKYCIMSYENSQHYTPIFFKYFDVESTYVAENHVKYNDTYTGVFIDIMPLDGMPSSNIKIKWLLIKRKIYTKLNILIRYNNPKNSFEKLLLLLIKNKNFDYYSKKLDSLFKNYELSTSKYVAFPWRTRKRMIFPSSYFETGIFVPFEGNVICVPKKYDDYLKAEFGNYMQLPPKSKQIAHKPAIFDLNKGYKEYCKKGKE